jgi:Fe-S-cluster containining protein
MDEHLTPLDDDTAFGFTCFPQVPCFNECCRDLTQFLTPYDVLRLRQGLGLASREFLGRYTRRHTGPDSGLPVVTLTPADPVLLTCPFVTPEGCRVYADRPSSCRIYPVVRLLRRCRQTGSVTEDHFLLREPHCRGFDQNGRQTVRQWMSGQHVAEYHAENDRLLEIIALKNRLRPGPLPEELAELVYAAFYDLDRFREQGLKSRLPFAGGMEPGAVRATGGDDLALLRLALGWVKRLLEAIHGP